MRSFPPSPLQSPSMSQPGLTSTGARIPRWRDALLPACAFAAVIALLRIIYLAFFCPYTLIEDEAQYWVWSRMLDWSYYTKGPGVAWVLWCFTAILGDAEWVVRLPAVIAGAIAAVSIAGLAFDITRSVRIALLSAVAITIIPAYLALAMLMTIDGPLVACWSLAAWCAWSAAVRNRWWCWPALGLVLAVGVLFKYTILLLIPGLLIWAIIQRKRIRTPFMGIAVCCTLAALATLPVILWNANNDWATVKHLLGHLGFAEGNQQAALTKKSWTYNPLWTLTLIGTQLAMIGPVLVLGLLEGLRALRQRNAPAGTNPAWLGESFLLACSLPVLAFYLLVSFVTEPEGNWPIASGVTLTILAAMRVARATQVLTAARNWTRFVWRTGIILALLLCVATLRLDLLARVPGLGFIPAGRFTNAHLMGNDIARLVNILRTRSGQEPFIIANHYGRASHFWYYTPGNPRIHCSSSLMPGGRTTPWDFWPDLSLHDPALLGRPAVVSGLSAFHWKQVFEHVERVGLIAGDHKVNKQGKPSRPVYLAFGYKGFPAGGVRDWTDNTRDADDAEAVPPAPLAPPLPAATPPAGGRP